MSEKEDSKSERCAWRDQALSEWHRTLGYDLPAVDLDFVLVEYTHGLPAALIEYKHENAKKLRLDHPSISAIRCIAERARVPFFVVRYNDSLFEFTTIPVNSFARKYVSERRAFTASEYKSFLEALREAVVKIK